MTAMQIIQTIAAPAFDKWHVQGLSRLVDFHIMKTPDLGAPHDHPWDFRSTIIRGSYVEEIYEPSGVTRHVMHKEGETFLVPAERVHRIVELPEGNCETMIVCQEHVRHPWGYFEWRDGRPFKRIHNENAMLPFDGVML